MGNKQCFQLFSEVEQNVAAFEIVSERVSRQALVREVEVGVIMDYRTAVLFRDWLSQQLEKLKPIEAAKRKEPL